MPSPIGADTVTSISRHHIMPEIVDNLYRSNALLYRARASQRIISGGTHIEVPIMYARFAAGGPYSGLDVLTMSPSDTVRNARWDWKQHYVPVVIDGLTLIKADTPLAIANQVRFLFQQAEIEMADNLGTGIFSDGTTDPKEITGLRLAVNSTGTYANLARATYTWWVSAPDTSTTTMTMLALQNQFGTATEGGRTPTIIVSRQANYNRYWNLSLAYQQQQIPAGGSDDQLASIGFKNISFNGVPWIVDSHVSADTDIFMLNEDYIHLGVSNRADFYLEDFQTPINQDALAAKLYWAGELIVMNPARQGRFTALTA